MCFQQVGEMQEHDITLVILIILKRQSKFKE